MRRALPGCMQLFTGQGQERMKHKTSVFYYSLISALLCASGANGAGIRVGNLSRNNADGPQQVNEMRYNSVANTIAAQQELPPPPPAINNKAR